jgi:hypothetical protein
MTDSLDSLASQVEIHATEPIQFEQVGIDWTNIALVIITIISTWIVIRDRIKRPKAGCKILCAWRIPEFAFDTTNLKGEVTHSSGLQIYLHLLFHVIDKNLFYKDLKVLVKFRDDPTLYNGTIHWVDEYDAYLGDVKYKVRLPKDGRYLSFDSVLEQGKAYSKFLMFLVNDYKGDSIFEEIQLVFITPESKEIKTVLRSEDLNITTVVFDPDVWIPAEVDEVTAHHA